MQVRGTFPELNNGMTRSKAPRGAARTSSLRKASLDHPGFAGFSTKRQPRRVHAPRSFAGRRSASHAKAYSD